MVILLCLVMVAALAYAMAREGLAEAVILLVTVLITGFVALATHQPLADILAGKLAGTMAEGTEDAIALAGIFCGLTFLLRWLSQKILPWQVSFPPVVNQAGGAMVGLVIGWLAGGIFACVLATLPWEHNSWGMESPVQADQAPSGFRTIFPSDLIWLAGTRKLSAPSKLGNKEAFDSGGSYFIRFQRHRSGSPNSKAQPFKGEPYSQK